MKQYMIQQDFEIQDILNKPIMAHLATFCEGGPRDSPLWLLYENNIIWLFGTDKDSFIIRLVNDPRCALSVVEFDLEKGVLQHVGVRGTAIMRELDHERLNNFISKYLGYDKKLWNKWFVTNIVNPINKMVEIRPTSIVAKDVSFFKTGPELAKID